MTTPAAPTRARRPLRIFLCCQQDLVAHPVPAYRFWAPFFRGSFAEAGHSCLEAPGCDWAAGLAPQPAGLLAAWRDATWQRAVDWIGRIHAREPIDLFLSYLFPHQVHPGALAELRAKGIPCVNFFCDNVRLFRRVPETFHGFDLHWVPEADALGLYRRAGLPHLHAPMACWVPPEFRAPPGAESLPPTFVGTRDGQRADLFARAFRIGLEMDLRGAGWEGGSAPAVDPPRGRGWNLLRNQWAFAREQGPGALGRRWMRSLRPPAPTDFDFAPHVKPPPSGPDYWRVIRECRVCVGVNRYPSFRHPVDQPGRYSRLRDIEAPMAGACYVAEWAPGLESLYEPGREIELYRDPEELVAKVSALDRDPPRRRRLREAGQRRALADHGIARTIEAIAGRLGVPSP
jgi:hypothetical protein